MVPRLVALCVLATLVCVGDASVVELTDANFVEQTSKSGVWYIEFYAPWCGHCKHLAPTWEALAQEYSGDARVHIAKVDCTGNSKTCSQFGVNGYPTLLLLSDDGQVYTFERDRNVIAHHKEFIANHKTAGGAKRSNPLQPSIATDVKKLKQALHSETITALTSDNIESSISSGKWLVFAVATWCRHCQAMEPVIEAVAKASIKERFRVGRVDCDDESGLCSQLGVTSFPHIVLVQNGQQIRFNGPDRSEGAFRLFAATDMKTAETTPLVLPKNVASQLPRIGVASLLDTKSFDVATMNGAWLVIFVDSARCGAPCTTLVDDVLPLFVQGRGITLRLGVLDCHDDPTVCAEYNVTTFPTVMLMYRERGFQFTGETPDAKSLALFVDDGFRTAPTFNRVHISSKLRLSWDNVLDGAAWADFLRKYRYIVLGSAVFGLVLFGLLLGSACAWLPPRGTGAQGAPQYYRSSPPAAAAAETKKRR